MKPEPSPVSITESQGTTPPAGSIMLRSTLLLFFLAFPMYFMVLVFHEGGHALHTLAVGGQISLFYIHPFPMAGYSRPPVEYWENVWFHAAGPALGLLVSLLIFLLFWKRRSVSSLPLLMVFPMAAIGQGFVMLMVMGDFTSIVLLTGLSPTIFRVMGLIIGVAGIFLFVSLFPLLGLAPRDLRSLFAVPAALFLWALVGLIVGTLVVPGSPADVVHGLGEEILAIAKSSLPLYLIAGTVLAGTHVSLYRRLYPKLPSWLRAETVTLTWKDLRLPAVLAAVSVILGLIIIV
jgi:hypothetical protein